MRSLISKLYFSLNFLLPLLLISCNSHPPQTQNNSNFILQKQKNYYTCLETEIRAHKDYNELRSLRDYINKQKFINLSLGRSYIELIDSIVNNVSTVDSLLNNYNYDLFYEMDINIIAPCIDSRTITNSILDSLFFSPLNVTIASSKKPIISFLDVLYKADTTLVNTNGFKLGLLNFIYTKYKEDQLEKLTTINIYIKPNSIFIEDQPTTLDNFEQQLRILFNSKRKELQQYNLENRLTAQLVIDGKTKMGKVTNVKRILRRIKF